MEENLIEMPDEYLLALGKLVTNAARLEQYLNTLIGTLAGFNLSDPIPFIMVNHIGVSQKIDMVSAICGERLSGYPHLEKYENVISEAKAAISLRNKYVHNSMLFDPDEGCCLMATASARGKLKVSMDYVKLTDIEEASNKVRRTIAKIHNLILNTNHPIPD